MNKDEIHDNLYTAMLVLRPLAIVLAAGTVYNLGGSATLPSGEIIPTVNMSLDFLWTMLGVIIITTIIKFISLAQTVQTSSMLAYVIFLASHVVRTIAWIFMLAYALVGVKTDNSNWTGFAVLIGGYLVIELIYTLVVAKLSIDAQQ